MRCSMELVNFKNSIFITRDGVKKSLIKRINASKKLINIKVISLSELKKMFFFDYTEETIFYISKKYNVISDIAKIYVENLYFLNSQTDILDEKVEFLKKLKVELTEKNLLIVNRSFRNFLKNRKIVLYNLFNLDKFYECIFEILKLDNEVVVFDSSRLFGSHSLFCAKNKEEEMAFIASKIAKLIREGTDLSKIKIANVQNDYIFTIKKIFKYFKIPVELPKRASINGTVLVSRFKQLFCEDMESVFRKLKSNISNHEEELLYNKILSIVNKYSWADKYEDVKTMIFQDISETKMESTLYRNSIKVVDFPDCEIEDDEHLFLINFNQGVLPKSVKDERFLGDSIRKKLGIDTSVEENVKSIDEIRRKISTVKNIYISYSSHDLTSELYISPAYIEDIFTIDDIEIDYTLSNSYNKACLISAKDEYRKFGSVQSNLKLLNAHYENEEYCSYDNKFKGIIPAKIQEFLGQERILSYTNLNSYYSCAFKYYLEYVLKLDKFEDTFQSVVGTIFHAILAKCFYEDFNFEVSWTETVSNQKYNFNEMEKFFLEHLKEELIFIIATIKEQMGYTNLKDALYEEKITVPIDSERNIIFKGFLDKIIFKETEYGKVAVIIDYKTGSPNLNLEYSLYGLNMQLPSYIYLLKHSTNFKDAIIGGFYLQRILENAPDIEKRKESLKLLGYSNSNIDILRQVDTSFENSKIIKSLKVTSNGFASYSKVLSDREMNSLSDLVEKKIKEAASDIVNANFSINPKEVNGKLEGCKFCKFRDICYRKNADIVKIQIEKDELFGGD